MTTDQDLQAKIAVLRKGFVAGLAARFAELDGALAALMPGQPLAAQAAPVKTILEQAHKIAGSAGTFGLSDMSVIASQTEQLCDRILKNQHDGDTAALDELRGKIAGIKAEATK